MIYQMISLGYRGRMETYCFSICNCHLFRAETTIEINHYSFFQLIIDMTSLIK